jgi:hypothetical protein
VNKDFLELTVQIARALRILEVHIPDAVGNLFIADIIRYTYNTYLEVLLPTYTNNYIRHYNLTPYY